MLGRNRFLVLLVGGGVTLAVISLSLQFCECAPPGQSRAARVGNRQLMEQLGQKPSLRSRLVF